MNKYVALLRGINVGGNNIIKMAELKIAFEKNSFTNVKTYINSGNVIFESAEKDIAKITQNIEKDIAKTFKQNLQVVVISQKQLETVISEIPTEWKKGHDLRCYIAFIKEPFTPADFIKEVKLKENVDSVKTGKKVVYMSTKLEGLTKSGFTKLAGTKIYKNITIRNLNTSQKLLALMSN